MKITRLLLPAAGIFSLLLLGSAAVLFAGSRPSAITADGTASLTLTPTASVTLTATATVTATSVLAAAAFLPALRRDMTPTPTSTPTPTPSPTPNGYPADNLAFEQAIYEQINEERQANSLPLLTLDERLTQSARRHARDMADNQQLSHTGSDGSTARQRIAEAGYNDSWYGENIGWGFSSPESMMTWWLNSAPHRANILHNQFTDVGVGYAWNGIGPYFHHWVLNFGRPAAGGNPDARLVICVYQAGTPGGGSSALVLGEECNFR